MQTRYFSRAEAARYLTSCGMRISRYGLDQLAVKKSGPPYSILRGRAVYLQEELDAWLKAEFDRNARARSA